MNYIVPEDRLIELLTAEFNLTALERGGVDNWSWYGDSIEDYINLMSEENNHDFEDYEELAEFFVEKEFKKEE